MTSLREEGRERVGKQLYEEYVNEADIHSNRFPSWQELTDSQRERWRQTAPLMPHLCDRADGVRGHYCVGRMRRDGYFEYWNGRGNNWSGFADRVLTIAEARVVRDKLIAEMKHEEPKPGVVGW